MQGEIRHCRTMLVLTRKGCRLSWADCKAIESHYDKLSRLPYTIVQCFILLAAPFHFGWSSADVWGCIIGEVLVFVITQMLFTTLREVFPLYF